MTRLSFEKRPSISLGASESPKLGRLRFKVMAIVGHSEMSTTNEYLRLAGVDVKEDTTDKLGYHLYDGPKSNIVNLFGHG